jgi:hypothetical protein
MCRSKENQVIRIVEGIIIGWCRSQEFDETISQPEIPGNLDCTEVRNFQSKYFETELSYVESDLH